MSSQPNNLTSDSFWIRTLFLMLFYIVYRLLDLVVLVVMIGQWLHQLITNSEQQALKDFGYRLGVYSAQIVQYLTAASEHKPFPFNDWPESEPVAEADTVVTAEATDSDGPQPQ